MKHCPNPDCPFLQQYKLIAEFRDEIEVCPDCGTLLVPGEAPDVELPTPAYQPLFPENREPDLVALCAVEAEADAEFYKEKLEFQGIPVRIVRAPEADEDNDAQSDAKHDPKDEVAPFELQVLRSDLMRATHFLDTLAPAEADDLEEDDTEEDAAEEDDEAYTANFWLG